MHTYEDEQSGVRFHYNADNVIIEAIESGEKFACPCAAILDFVAGYVRAQKKCTPIHYNADASGDVIIEAIESGEKFACPCAAILDFVAGYVRAQKKCTPTKISNPEFASTKAPIPRVM